MPQSWKIMDPTAEARKPPIHLSCISDLNGKVVSFVSNEIWTCLPVIWNELDKVLRQVHGVSETFKVAVPDGRLAPSQVFDDIAKKSDAVILALGH